MIALCVLLSYNSCNFTELQGLDMSKVTSLSMNWQVPQSYDEFYKLSSLCLLSAASYMTDPACAIDQYLTGIAAVDELPPSPFLKKSFNDAVETIRYWTSIDLEYLASDDVIRNVYRCFLHVRLVPAALLSPLGVGGILCRNLAKWFDPEPLTVLKGDVASKDLPENNEFTICTANICGIEGGYATKEGGVIPIVEWPISNRLDAIIEDILQRKPDVLCLNEVFNINYAIYISHRLKDTYANFVFGCGVRGTGTNSGLFVASVFDIEEATFQAFTQDQLAGSATGCGKGILEVAVKDSKGAIASVYALHLNHSEEPERAVDFEVNARKLEMEAVIQKIEEKGDRNVIVLGDLNMDDAEMQKQNILGKFTKNETYTDSFGNTEYTWSGDEWYVNFSNTEPSLLDTALKNAGLKEALQRTPSGGVNLDHIMVYNREENTPELKNVHLEKTGYDPEQISWEALSDHRPVVGTIKIKDR